MTSPDRLPEQVFGRLPLAEERQILVNRPTRLETITVYNNVMARFMAQRRVLLTRYINGEFQNLSTIVTKSNSGEVITPEELQLARDFGTLIHGQIASFSRKNLNLANYIERIEQIEADDVAVTSGHITDRGNYQRGRFDQIYGGS